MRVPSEPVLSVPQLDLRDSLLRSRYENKYVVPTAMVPSLRRFLQPFVRPDAHARRSTDGRYPICSLYFDTQDRILLRMGQEGKRDRFKLRARVYSERPDSPVFLEIKRRAGGIIHKERVAVERTIARAFLAARVRGEQLGLRINGSPRGEFAALALGLDARPLLRVRYFREAYESRGGDPVRITFDTDIRFAPGEQGEVWLGSGPWRSLPVDGTLMEIKFTNVFPSWLHALISRFDLVRRSFSKYGLSMAVAPRGAGGAIDPFGGGILPGGRDLQGR